MLSGHGHHQGQATSRRSRLVRAADSVLEKTFQGRPEGDWPVGTTEGRGAAGKPPGSEDVFSRSWEWEWHWNCAGLWEAGSQARPRGRVGRSG